MNFGNLKCFVALAHTLNFTKAAKLCYLSQPAISAAISNLENELQFKLFERNKHSVRLTPAGKDFYGWAQQVLQSYDNLIDRDITLDALYSGQIKMAFSGSFEAGWLMPQLQLFLQRYSSVSIEPLLLPPSMAIEALLAEQVDVVAGIFYDLRKREDVWIQDVGRFSEIAALSTAHPYAVMEQIPVELFRNERIVVLKEKHMPEAVSHFQEECALAGLYPAEVKQMHCVEDMLLYLMLNKSIAIVPSFYTPFFERYLVFREIAAPHKLMMDLSVAALRGNRKPAVQKLLLFLQENYTREPVVERSGGRLL